MKNTFLLTYFLLTVFPTYLLDIFQSHVHVFHLVGKTE